MDYIYLTLIVSSISTIAIILTYVYLYITYHERYMGVWAISWLVLLSKYLIFDSGLLPWKNSLLGMAVYQLLILGSVILFVVGTHIFINKPLQKWWIYTSLIVSVFSASSIFIFSTLIYKLIIPIYFCCFAGIWIGFVFIRHLQLHGYGHLITGYAYIAWSVLNFSAPFTLGWSWFLPWAFSAGGILRMLIAMGTLMVYFEKTRTQLTAQQKQYRILTENAVDIIYYLQLIPERKLLYVSPAVLALTRYLPEDYYNDNSLVFKLVHPDDRHLLINFINTLPELPEPILTLRLLHNSKVVWLEQKCVPIHNDAGKMVAIEGILRDITDRIKLEQISSAYDKMNMVGSMAATVAHEIRNPMTTIRGYLQILQKKADRQSDKEKFTLMIEEIDRANIIIKEYLSLSHNKISNLKVSSLNNIIESLFPLIQANAAASNVYAKLDLENNIPNLLLDESEIRQLLLNMTCNSIEAMSSGGNLILKTYHKANKVILTISDDGPGIPDYVLHNLGTPFITTKDAGTGLGLPLCYQIAYRHKAKLQLDTSSLGTTFYLNFNI